jgi:glyoxylase-like metal-dependent hydrolase (beta-lactamase superfamily II)
MTDPSTIEIREKMTGDILGNLRERQGIHLFRISTPLPEFKVNIFFVEKPVPTIIDAPPNNAVSLDELDGELKVLGYSVDDIKIIIVTHPHFDHFGAAETIAERSGARILTTRATCSWLENFDHQCAEEERFNVTSLERAGAPEELIHYSAQYFWFMTGFARAVKPSRCLEIGETIDLGSGNFRVERVPGHTPWCIMLHNAKERIAFTGDFLLKDISSNPLIQRPWTVPNGYKSLKAYTSSLQRVADMHLELALPGHGDLIENPGERIMELLGFMDARARQIITVLREGSRLTVFDIVREVFPELSRDQLFLAVSEIFAHLEILEDLGVARRSQDLPPRFTAL